MKRFTQHPISKLTSFQNDGSVDQVLVFESLSELQDFLKNDPPPFRVIGKGSNSVIDPQITDTLIKVSPQMMPMKREGNRLFLPAGYTVMDSIKTMLKESLSGLEFIAGVPASLGGMLTMNYGCWGQEIANYVQTVLYLTQTGDLLEIPVQECEYGYRSSIFQRQKGIILGAWFRLTPKPTEDIRALVKEIVDTRLSKQPMNDKTFGSIFKNPGDGLAAAAIIDELGLKGTQVGAAMISEQHANFMVNRGAASFEDVKSLIQKIQAVVWEQKQIRLEPELCFFEKE